MKLARICLVAVILTIGWCSRGAARTFLTGLEFEGLDGVAHLYGFEDETEVFSTASSESAFNGTVILNNSVLVADSATDAIRRYSFTGSPRTNFATIDNPSFLEVDHAGNVYVTQSVLGPAVATRLDSRGNVTGTYVSPRPGRFAGIDADSNGNVYIAFRGSGSNNDELQKYASSGAFLSSVPIKATAYDITIHEAIGRLFLANTVPGDSDIQIYDIRGTNPIYNGAIAAPSGTAVLGLHFSDELGTIFATDFGPTTRDPRGFQLALDGTLLSTYRPAGAVAVLDITYGIPEPRTSMLIVGLMIAAVGSRLRTRH